MPNPRLDHAAGINDFRRVAALGMDGLDLAARWLYQSGGVAPITTRPSRMRYLIRKMSPKQILRHVAARGCSNAPRPYDGLDQYTRRALRAIRIAFTPGPDEAGHDRKRDASNARSLA